MYPKEKQVTIGFFKNGGNHGPAFSFDSKGCSCKGVAVDGNYHEEIVRTDAEGLSTKLIYDNGVVILHDSN